MRPVQIRTLATMLLVLGACSEADKPNSTEESEVVADEDEDEGEGENENGDEDEGGSGSGSGTDIGLGSEKQSHPPPKPVSSTSPSEATSSPYGTRAVRGASASTPNLGLGRAARR